MPAKGALPAKSVIYWTSKLIIDWIHWINWSAWGHTDINKWVNGLNERLYLVIECQLINLDKCGIWKSPLASLIVIIDLGRIINGCYN